MRISDWSSDVCSSDLGGEGEDGCRQQGDATRDADEHEGVRRSEGDRPHPRLQALSFVTAHGHCAPGTHARYEPGDPVASDRQHRDAHQQGQSHRSEEHTSELQSLMRTSYAVSCLKKKNNIDTI